MQSSATAKHQVLLEYSGLGPEYCPLGIYVIPLANDPFSESNFCAHVHIRTCSELVLHNECLAQMTYVLSVWLGTHFVHRGYWAGSVLRFRLDIPRDYPASAPEVTYTGTAIVHPLIDPATGRVRLDSRFSTWRPRQDYIIHILFWMKAIFKRRDLDSIKENACANPEAYRM